MIEATSSDKQITKVEQRVSRGLAALFFRQIISYGTIFLGNILLSRWLSIQEYGIFAAVLAFQQTLVILSDVGLGPALVQRNEKPTNDEIASLFTLQMILFGVITIVVWIFAPSISQLVQIGLEGIFLVRALAITFLITAFRSIPAILLERDLRFDVIAFSETTGLVLYQVVLLALVWFKFGLNSIIWALAIRYLLDMIIILYFYPWRPQLSFKFRLVFSYVRFGINMQGVRIMAYAKDSLPILLLVPFLGASSAGIWSWALTYIGIPVYFCRLVDRTMFPAYSRVQLDRQAVGELANTAFWLNFAFGLPVLMVLILYGPNIIPLIYGSTWLIALPVAVFLIPNMIGGFITGSGFPIIYGTGQSGKAFRLFAAWVVLTFALGVIGVVLAKLIGLAVAFSIATLIITGLLLFLVRPAAEINLNESLLSPVVAAIGAGLSTFILLRLNIVWPVVLGISILIYCAVLFGLDHRKILRLVRIGFRKE